ncbi:hypothetical protein [Roseivivax isoporae]|uniref:Uncharacterized protein n=1 Tax=Roseivivax isoporae LMG 25204 TaxID=1449351 RepID=X7FA54_9RHOB|nr:hypothetical protein [Roseivivax isoporae]ETX29563.1 hypothetical protein RISW2_23790 [Roseivivax isoporae LMG 25204]
MSDHNTSHHTHTRETRVERGGSGPLAFIVGGLVVAVGILAFVFWGGGAPDGATGSAGGGDVSISVEGGEGGEAAAEGSAGTGAEAGAAAGDDGAAAGAEASGGN